MSAESWLLRLTKYFEYLIQLIVTALAYENLFQVSYFLLLFLFRCYVKWDDFKYTVGIYTFKCICIDIRSSDMGFVVARVHSLKSHRVAVSVRYLTDMHQ